MSPELRQQVRDRARGRCEYCRLPEAVELAGPFHAERRVELRSELIAQGLWHG